MTFCWNPQHVFNSPVKATVLSSFCKGLKMETKVRLSFSARPPSPKSVSGIFFPFPKNFQPVTIEDVVVDEPTFGILPPTFLQDMASNPLFNFHIGIGLPENDIIPTLSYSDFFNLNTNNNLNWVSISRYIHSKYTELEKQKISPIPARFLTSLAKHNTNAGHEKSVVLFPGRWEGFNLSAAHSLAQKLLSSSPFNVFIATRAHPLSTEENSHELNPHVTGNGSLSDVESRFFCTTPVGMGEMGFKDVVFNFQHNIRKFFFLKMKKTTTTPTSLLHSHMFQPIQFFSPKNYQPEAPSPTGSEISDEFFLASFSRGEKKVLDALAAAGVHKRLIPDPDRVWSNFATFQLYSFEDVLSRDLIHSFFCPPPLPRGKIF